MNTTRQSRVKRVLAMTVLLTMLCGILLEAPALAASFTTLKPKIKTDTSAYINGSLVLYWTKVTGATGYEVYRAKTKGGKYSKFATTTKTKLTKKTSGTYFYKVRAVKGSKKSRFSNPVHVFAANGRITNKSFSATSGLQMRVLVTNKSAKNMNFLAGSGCTIYLVNKSTKKAVGSAYAGMTMPTGAMVLIVGAKAQQAVWLQAYDYSLWQTYKSAPTQYAWLVTMPFYPGNGDDEAITFALAAGEKASDSAVAVRG